MNTIALTDAQLVTLMCATTTYIEHLRGDLAPFNAEAETPQRDPRPDAPQSAQELAALDALRALRLEHRRRAAAA